MATHYVARELLALGHNVRQVPPAYAKPFRQGHKNDFRDAYAIAEAVQRPSTRFVPVKTDDQLDLQALHRVRSRLISERTAVIDRIRRFSCWSAEFRSAKGFTSSSPTSRAILAKRVDVLSPRMIRIVEDLGGDWQHLDEHRLSPEEIEQLAHGTESWQFRSGHWPNDCSAIVAAIGNGASFAKGRDFAAWLGLVPKQMSTGNRRNSSGISADRSVIVICARCSCKARVILLRPVNWAKHSFGPWLTAAAKRLHHNVLATALANKLARIAWTIWRRHAVRGARHSRCGMKSRTLSDPVALN